MTARPLKDFVSHGACRVAWAWLRLVAMQELLPAGAAGAAGLGSGAAAAAAGAAGSGAGATPAAAAATGSGVWAAAGVLRAGRQRPWVQFLVDRLKVVEHVRQVMVLSSEVDAEWSDRRNVREAARGVLPAALDVLEVLAGARPGEVASALLANAEARAQRSRVATGAEVGRLLAHSLPGLPLDRRVRDLLMQHGRGQLEGVLDRLLQDGREGRVAGREGRWGDVEREEVAGRLVGGSCNVPWLPFPGLGDGEGGAVLIPRCAYGWCCELIFSSEVELQLRACGRCRAVRYCSTECQRADWAAGHKGVCVRAAARQQGARGA